MGWFGGVIVYLLLWWTTLFTVLPWGNRLAENPVPGQAHSAPDAPRLAKKFLITTGISFMLWVVIYLLVQADLIDLSGIADNMMEKDTGS